MKKYMKNMFKNIKNVLDETSEQYFEETNYLEKMFINLRDLSEIYENKGDKRGLLVLFGDEGQMDDYTKQIPPNGDSEYVFMMNEFIKKHKGMPLLDSPKYLREVLDTATKTDGGLFFSEDGILLGQKRFVMAAKSDEHHTEGGTRHIAGRYASKKGMPAVVMSETRGTITTYRNGIEVEELCYTPTHKKSYDIFPNYFDK